MPELTAGDPAFRADTGEADPGVTAALAAFRAGTGSEQAALVALSVTRLLVPVVAMPGEDPASGGAIGSEMATPTVVGRDGRQALPAFTSLQSVRRWRSDARPVPVPARSVWQSAAQQGQAVIVDIAGPVPLPVDGARLAALASGAPVPALHEDPDVVAIVAQAAAAQPAGTRIRLGPGPDGADLTLLVEPAGPSSAGPALRAQAEAVGQSIAAEVAGQLAGRSMRGLVLMLPSATDPG